jgi:hypothetical protein
VDKSLESLGVAVIEIQPASFLGQNNRADTAKLALLANLLKSCQSICEVTTLESWYQYASSLISTTPCMQKPLPLYDGGTAIVFRLDDVSKGYLEDIVQEIIKLFQQNGVPLDCGVVAFANGYDSFKIPWLKQYFDKGAVGISVHGYDWTYYQLDTTGEFRSLRKMEDNPCINLATARLEAPSDNQTYLGIKSKLLKARAEYLKYFGCIPESFTVPTDFFDETGYRAVQNAGFKVFSTQINTEPHPSSAYPVNYFGNKDINGMYRLPTASDVCIWDNCTWQSVFDISKQASIQNYCKYHGAWDELLKYNDLAVMLCTGLDELGVAAIGIHPSCFVDEHGKPDIAKLEKLDKIIKWCKSFATIMTFDQWYRYKTERK